MSRRTSEKVYLHVYDLAWVNQYVSWAGLGVFHSGVFIYGYEICFGGHPGESTGIFKVPPKYAPGAMFREAILIGETSMSSREVERLLDEMGREFTGSSYHLVNRNCNHFADEFCRRTMGRGIPGWVNRLAFMGSYVSCVLPPELGGPIPAPEDSDPSPHGPLVPQPSRAVFAGSGRSLAEGSGGGERRSGTDGESLTVRRELAARAALSRLSTSATLSSPSPPSPLG
eukprot:TRINITY_DN1791_c0_g4_i1.p1 TRINITY_DN1791_c0_g4~~TRINITY_DN1791_c0_g4_i1.p1  ORF type:complete len:228 (+),score=15.50 TRINITY_DN1791_c0_g4_i1:305-988(+)